MIFFGFFTAVLATLNASTQVDVVLPVLLFSQSSIVEVETLEKAIHKAQDPYENHANVVYHIKTSNELFFQAQKSHRLPLSKVQEPENDGTESLPEFQANGLIDRINNILDSAENADEIQKKKLPQAIGYKPKVNPKPLVMMPLKWIAQKVEVREEKMLQEMLPVTPCLDSTYGDGGSILFSHGSTITTDSTYERTINFGYLLYLELKRKQTDSLSTSYSYTISGTIPKGQKGQIFIKNPKILSSLITQTSYMITDVVEKGQPEVATVEALDYTSSHEYHFLTSDKHTLKCGANLLS